METYDIKKESEGVWFTIQTATVAVVGWALLAYTSMDAVVVVPVAAACGTLTRPVLGYITRFLPDPPKKGE